VRMSKPEAVAGTTDHFRMAVEASEAEVEAVGSDADDAEAAGVAVGVAEVDGVASEAGGSDGKAGIPVTKHNIVSFFWSS